MFLNLVCIALQLLAFTCVLLFLGINCNHQTTKLLLFFNDFLALNMCDLRGFSDLGLSILGERAAHRLCPGPSLRQDFA